jgi:hypothetical protein
MITRFLLIPVCTLSLVLVSCNGSADHENTSAELTDTVKLADTATLTEEESDVSYNLPSALQIAYVFKKSGSAFIPTLANDVSNVNKYNTSNYKRATNFGVYSADLAYCLFNKKYQESKQYLKACKDIGSFLGLNQAFETDNTAQRFEKNIANEDSTVKIVSAVQLKTDVMFEQNKQKHITVIAFTGAWTESAYIAAEVYAKDKNKKALVSFMEQLLLSETIIKALKHYEASESEMPVLITAIQKINSEFRAIPAVKAALEKDEEMDFTDMAVSDAELKDVTASIKTLRKSIID